MKNGELNVFDEALVRGHWPIVPAEEQTFPIENESLFAAAQALALLAYPSLAERVIDGPAHRFCTALVAQEARLAKRCRAIPRLPPCAESLKPETMRNRIKRGGHRLANRISATNVIFSAMDRVEQQRRAERGERATFSLQFSPDFSRATITMPYRREELRIRLVGSTAEPINPSLKAAILYHREAFGMGSGDPNHDYANIYNRHIKPIFPVFNLALIVNQAWLERGTEAAKRGWGLIDILMEQHDWAANIDASVRSMEGKAIWFLRSVGFATCSCRMLKLQC